MNTIKTTDRTLTTWPGNKAGVTCKSRTGGRLAMIFDHRGRLAVRSSPEGVTLDDVYACWEALTDVKMGEAS